MKTTYTMLTHNRARQGFSLVELAIVLTIAGIIVTAIWMYAGNATDSVHRQQLAEEMQTVVNNVHALYSGQAGIGSSGDSISVVTPLLIQQNAIPSTMVRNGGACTNAGPTPPPADLCADDPWGPTGNAASGTFGVCAWTGGPKCPPAPTTGTVQFFAIELSGVPLATCINIAPQDSVPGAPTGLQDVWIDGISTVATTKSLPVSVAFATANCTAASTIDFIYRLQAAAF